MCILYVIVLWENLMVDWCVHVCVYVCVYLLVLLLSYFKIPVYFHHPRVNRWTRNALCRLIQIADVRSFRPYVLYDVLWGAAVVCLFVCDKNAKHTHKGRRCLCATRNVFCYVSAACVMHWMMTEQLIVAHNRETHSLRTQNNQKIGIFLIEQCFDTVFRSVLWRCS